MAAPPPPLTPPDCDLRNFPYMPLDVVRLRDSDIAGLDSGEAFRCAVLLWCASWHQLPAASLPDDDAALARLALYGRDVESFRTARAEGAMRGWIKCSDGRLYHPVVAEKARASLASKIAQRARTENARRARLGGKGSVTGQSEAQSSQAATAIHDDSATSNIANAVTHSVTENVTDNVEAVAANVVTISKGEEGRIRDITIDADFVSPKSPTPAKHGKASPTRRRKRQAEDPAFAAFRAAYPKADTKPARTAAAWAKATRSATPEEIMKGLAAHRFAEEERYRPDPSKWLNDESWRAVVRPLLDRTLAGSAPKSGDVRTGDGRVLSDADLWDVAG